MTAMFLIHFSNDSTIMREQAVLCLGPIQSWQTDIHFVFVFDFVPVFVFSIVSLVFLFVFHFAFLFVFAIVFERMDVNPWCCTTSSLSLTLKVCLFLSLTLCLYLSLTLCLSLTFCLCVKIKYLLRILGFLLNCFTWVKAICWDCASVYFNLQFFVFFPVRRNKLSSVNTTEPKAGGESEKAQDWEQATVPFWEEEWFNQGRTGLDAEDRRQSDTKDRGRSEKHLISN